MGKKKIRTPRNLVLQPSTAIAPVKSKYSWDQVGYKIVVGVVRRTVGIEVKETPGKVIGQALGLRNDGQSFFAAVDLPWVWPEDYRWQPMARKRLDTFLSDNCKCRSGNGDIITCDVHGRLRELWVADDKNQAKNFELQLKALDNMPLTSPHPGAMDMLRVLHLDYPWCRLDVNTNEWACLICSGRRQAYGNNSSYRNQFIFQHAECGNALAYGYKAKVAPDIRQRIFRECLDTLEAAMVRYGRAAASERAYQDIFETMSRGAEPKNVLVEEELNPAILGG